MVRPFRSWKDVWNSGLRRVQRSRKKSRSPRYLHLEVLEERRVLTTVSVVATDTTADEDLPNTGTFLFSRDVATASPLAVYFDVSGTALRPADYTFSPNATPQETADFSVTIPANETSVQVVLTPVNDNVKELSELVTVTIVSKPAYTIGTASDSITILDNDQWSVSIAANDADATEYGASQTPETGKFRVTRDGETDLTHALRVYFNNPTGTAGHGTDYTFTPNLYDDGDYYVTIAAGQTYADITVTPVNDSVRESNELATLTIATRSSYTIGTNSASVTIHDNDNWSVSIEANDANATERGVSETQDTGKYKITRSGETDFSKSLAVWFSRSGTATYTSDYTLSPFYAGEYDGEYYVIIAANQAFAEITLTAVNNSAPESDELATLTILTTSSYTIGTGSASVTVHDNDNWTMAIEATDPNTAENPLDPGTFRIKRSGETDPTYALSAFFLISGTATKGTDYSLSPNPPTFSGLYYITIAAGQTTATVNVQPIDDALLENNETVIFTLQSNPTLPAVYTIDGAKASATVTIAENEGYSILVVEDVSTKDSKGETIYRVNNECDCSCTCYFGTAQDPVIQISDRREALVMLDVTFSETRPVDEVFTVVWQRQGGSPTTVSYKLIDVDPDQDGKFRIGHWFDASSLATGRYSFTAKFDSVDMRPASRNYVFSSAINVVQGKSWLGGADLPGISSLVAGTGGMLWNRGDGEGYWFASGPGGTFTSPPGQFAKLQLNLDGTYTLRDRWDKTFYYNSAGLLVRRVESNGQETEYSYIDANSDSIAAELSTITGPSGQTVTLAYSSGRVSTLTDRAGRALTFSYDGSGRLASISKPDPDGGGPLGAMVTSYAYDGAGRLTSITSPGGGVTQLVRDSLGFLTEQIAPDGSKIEIDAYNTQGIPGIGEGTTLNPYLIKRSSDSLGTVTDGQKRVTAYSLDRLGNRTVEIDALGNKTIYERDFNGLALRISKPDPDGAGPLEETEWSYTYDTRGNKTSETLPNGETRTWVYHATWNAPIEYTDANGNVTLYEYAPTHRLLLSETTIVGLVDDGINLETDDLTTVYTYTAAPVAPGDPPRGLVETVTDPAGRVTEYEYNVHGYATEISYAAGTADEANVSFTYDAMGNVLTETDERGFTTTYVYDLLDRQIEVTLPDPDGGGPLTSPEILYVYDQAGYLESVTENGRVTLYDYNAAGQLLSVTEPDPDGGGPLSAPVTSYTYDSEGRVLTETDALGAVTTFAYTDGLLTSTTEEDPDDAGPQTAPVYTYTYDDAGRVLTVTDPLSRVTSYTYDAQGRRVRADLPDPDGAGGLPALFREWTYGNDGLLESETDEHGRTISYTYDGEGNILTETDELGTTTYEYNELGRLVSETTPDPDGGGALAALVTIYVYNAAGQLASVTTPSGTTSYTYDARNRRKTMTTPDPDAGGPKTAPVTSYTYDDAGNLLTETDPLGNVTTYQYDALNRVTQVTLPDPDGVGGQSSPVTSVTYDQFGNLATETDALGRVTSHAYDALNRLISTTQPDPDAGGPLTAPVTSYTYDALGQLLTKTDPLGSTTEFEYDLLGRLIQITQADPDDGGLLAAPATLLSYDAAGQLVSVTDPLGRVTSYQYDGLGRLTTTTEPDPDGGGPLATPQTTLAYNAAGYLATETDPLGRTKTYTYTAAGQVATMTDSRGTTTYTYDALGRQTMLVEPDLDGIGPKPAAFTEQVYDNQGDLIRSTTLNGDTLYQYDALRRLVKLTQPDPDGVGAGLAPWTVYEYDAAGNLLSETDRLGNETSYGYDNLYRETSKTDANGDTTTYQYDLVGNRIALIDPVDNTTEWVYDRLNRVIEETNEFNDTRYFEYDAVGNLVERTDRNGRVTEYTYDKLSRRTSEIWRDGVSTLRTLSYTYDAAGQLLTAGDADSEYTYQYDYLGRARSIAAEAAGLTPTVTLDQVFDAAGRRTSLAATIDSTDDFLNEYSYDRLDRMTRVTQAGQGGGHSVAEKRIDFSYSPEGRQETVTRYANLTGTTLVAESSFAFDGAGRLTGLTHAQGLNVLADYTWQFDAAGRLTQYVSPDGTSDYTYDDRGQLLEANHDYQADEAYDYDDNGNRIGGSYSTGTNNQILSDGTFNYTYDDEGNRLTRTRISGAAADDKTVEYTWDHRNRLTAVTFKNNAGTVTTTVEYTYDVFNRRIEKSIDADGAGIGTATSEFFVYDGEHIVLQLEANGDLLHRYVHGPAIDQILADENSLGEVLWPLTDHLGTVRDLAQYDDLLELTEIANHITYDSFGNVTSETNPAVDHLFGFTGRERDAETGLNYHRNRYYDPTTGSWLSQDPIGFEAGDENLYRYVGGSPTDATDPSGLRVTDEELGAMAPTPSVYPPGPQWTLGDHLNVGIEFVYGLGDGVWNIGTGVLKTGRETIYMGRDFAAATTETVARKCGVDLRFDDWSNAANALNSGEISPGRYYVEFGKNVITFGTAEQYEAFRAYMNNEISADEASERIGTVAVGQLSVKLGKWYVTKYPAAKKYVGRFPADPDDLTRALNVEPKIFTTQHGSRRCLWEPNSDTRIRFESHPGDAGPFNPRHHGEHYHIEIKPPHLSWNQAKKQSLIRKVKPQGYSPGHGTGHLPGEPFPGQ